MCLAVLDIEQTGCAHASTVKLPETPELAADAPNAQTAGPALAGTMPFDKFSARALHSVNHMLMTPMAGRRTTQYTLHPLMATYCRQRVTAVPVITEGKSPRPSGLGYPRLPGLYDKAQVDSGKPVSAAVHAGGGKILVRLMHRGRFAHAANLPTGAEILGPVTAVCSGELYTDPPGMQPHGAPRAMTDADIAHSAQEHSKAAQLALDAGFDGVELHSASGYLVEQVVNPRINLRACGDGGSSESRSRVTLEVAGATVADIGRNRVGIRLSPYGALDVTGEFFALQVQPLALAALDG
jgi:N-ethylmaleimide reductase